MKHSFKPAMHSKRRSNFGNERKLFRGSLARASVMAEEISDHPLIACFALLRLPPANTRAHGRGQAVAHFQEHSLPYLINWDSIALEHHSHLLMPDPFHDYACEVSAFLR
jgi:hypothetical protein